MVICWSLGVLSCREIEEFVLRCIFSFFLGAYYSLGVILREVKLPDNADDVDNVELVTYFEPIFLFLRKLEVAD